MAKYILVWVFCHTTHTKLILVMDNANIPVPWLNTVTKALPCFDHLVERRHCKQKLSMIAGETKSIYDIVHEVNKCARDLCVSKDPRTFLFKRRCASVRWSRELSYTRTSPLEEKCSGVFGNTYDISISHWFSVSYCASASVLRSSEHGSHRSCSGP
jgi:hypothetical protein